MKQFSRGIQTKIKNKIKKEAACKKEVGMDAKHVCFFTWPYSFSKRILENLKCSVSIKFASNRVLVLCSIPAKK